MLSGGSEPVLSGEPECDNWGLSCSPRVHGDPEDPVVPMVHPIQIGFDFESYKEGGPDQQVILEVTPPGHRWIIEEQAYIQWCMLT